MPGIVRGILETLTIGVRAAAPAGNHDDFAVERVLTDDHDCCWIDDMENRRNENCYRRSKRLWKVQFGILNRFTLLHKRFAQHQLTLAVERGSSRYRLTFSRGSIGGSSWMANIDSARS